MTSFTRCKKCAYFTHKASSHQPHSAPPGPSPRKKFLPFQHPAVAKCLLHKVLVIGHIIRYLDLGSKLYPAALWITLKDVLLACIHQAGFSIHRPTKGWGPPFMRRFPANVLFSRIRISREVKSLESPGKKRWLDLVSAHLKGPNEWLLLKFFHWGWNIKICCSGTLPSILRGKRWYLIMNLIFRPLRWLHKVPATFREKAKK